MASSSADILTDPPPPEADARVAYGHEPLQFGDLRLPSGPGPHPLVVVVHGGYWQAIYNLTHAGHLCVDLASQGVARRLGMTLLGAEFSVECDFPQDPSCPA